MGRQARRAQARAERRQKSQQTTASSAPPRAPRAPSVSAPSTPGAPRRRGSLLKPRWATDIISELRKVTWPSRPEIMHLTIVVLTVSIFFGAILGLADLGFGWLVEQTILR